VGLQRWFVGQFGWQLGLQRRKLGASLAPQTLGTSLAKLGLQWRLVGLVRRFVGLLRGFLGKLGRQLGIEWRLQWRLQRRDVLLCPGGADDPGGAVGTGPFDPAFDVAVGRAAAGARDHAAGDARHQHVAESG
jgi:hypothetical protein